MSLRVWLPLNGDLHNQGLGNVTATNYGATVDTSGKIGSCYNFDGTDDYLSLNNLNLGSKESFSICFWTYAGSNGLTNLIQIKSGSNVAFHMYESGKFSFRDSTHSNLKIVSFEAPIENIWTHYSIIYDNGNWYIYKNGIICGNFEASQSATFYPGASTFYIGARKISTGNYYFTGKLNDFRVYDHALSELEIKEIARAKVLHYPLSHNGYGMPNLLKLGNVQQTGNSQTAHLLYWYFDFSGNLPTGTYTLSFDAKTSNGTDNAYVSYANGSSTIVRISDLMAIPSTWKHYTFTFTNAASNCNDIFFTSYKSYGGSTSPNKNNTGYLYVRNVKLENGNKITPFALAASEDTSTTEYDISGYCNNGTKIGTFTYSTDTPKYGVSTSFDGTTNCIQVPYNTICPDNIFTFNLWFKKDDLGSKSYETLFGGPSGFEMDSRQNNQSTLSLYMASTRSGKRNLVTELTFNTWYMVTMVRDGIKERYYINGIFQSEIDAKPMPTGIYRIGAWASNTGQNYYGNISDFRIYTTALSAQDILDLYNNSTLSVSS